MQEFAGVRQTSQTLKTDLKKENADGIRSKTTVLVINSIFIDVHYPT